MRLAGQAARHACQALAKIRPGGRLSYVLNHWESLCAYASDGRDEIDSNAAEHTLRAIAIGRKNHLLSGSDSGGLTVATLTA